MDFVKKNACDSHKSNKNGYITYIISRLEVNLSTLLIRLIVHHAEELLMINFYCTVYF